MEVAVYLVWLHGINGLRGSIWLGNLYIWTTLSICYCGLHSQSSIQYKSACLSFHTFMRDQLCVTILGWIVLYALSCIICNMLRFSLHNHVVNLITVIQIRQGQTHTESIQSIDSFLTLHKPSKFKIQNFYLSLNILWAHTLHSHSHHNQTLSRNT